MKSKPKWLSTRNVAPEMIRDRTITVKDKMGNEIPANLEVETSENGEIAVLANYNSSPFPGTVALAKFYLTQEQLDVFLDKGPKCVLEPPSIHDSN